MNILRNKFHIGSGVNCRQEARKPFILNNADYHYEFDNIYTFNNKKTNHQELTYNETNLINTKSINKVYKGKLKIWYHRSVKDHKCLSETIPYEIITVAVKVIEQSDATENENNEPEMLYYFKDVPEIINQFGYHIDLKKKRCIIVLEWCEGNDLFEYLIKHTHTNKTISQITRTSILSTIYVSDVKNIIKWLVNVISVCHAHDICHLDLKLENIMLRYECHNNSLDPNSLRLLDFGGAKFIHDHDVNIEYNYICTSPHYTPPEVINKHHIDLNYDFLSKYELSGQNLCKIDVWQIGVITYTLLHSSFPFYSLKKKPINVLKEISKCVYPSFTTQCDPNGKKLCDDVCIDFIKKSMCFDPNKRCTIDDLMNHKWLQ